MLHAPILGNVHFDLIGSVAQGPCLTLDHPQETREILGVHVSAFTEAAALQLVHDHLGREDHLKLAFCNAHTANVAWAGQSFRAALAGFTTLPDGLGVDLASRMLHGAPFPANINGTDFVPRIFATSPAALTVMLVGGRPGVAERAAAALQQATPQHRFDVLHHGFFTAGEEADLLRRLRAARPDVLLVAMGNPMQELWIARHCSGKTCKLAIGVGALLDFLSGDVRRAPVLVRTMRLEWLWRLVLEPVRLFRRYVVGNPLFLGRVARARLSARARSGNRAASVPARRMSAG